MFADDWLMDQLVLKGGNAMDIVLQMHSRASVDLDFSLAKDLELEQALPRIQRALENTFRSEMDYLAFDIKMVQKPKSEMPDELAAFWGGYEVEFKLIARMRADELGHEVERMRREAIKLGQGPKFSIDISRYEYVEGKEARDLLGYRIFVYSPSMIVGEKVRAICQQMPEYAAIIKRQGLGNQRARDFVDIKALVEMFRVDMASPEFHALVRHMFEAKRVPLHLIGRIADGDVRDLHSLGFASVRDTMRPGIKLENFDHYQRFVVGECGKLEPLWNM
ncbi:MAG: nucleotidyl transferase AbiEii/AbiGii toxin family protein [Burkholderiales bacterium]|nr:nucleotidyl transferase AbiEii/AbiGii toxin family protein [Burkholderiales bacterium]